MSSLSLDVLGLMLPSEWSLDSNPESMIDSLDVTQGLVLKALMLHVLLCDLVHDLEGLPKVRGWEVKDFS